MPKTNPKPTKDSAPFLLSLGTGSQTTPEVKINPGLLPVSKMDPQTCLKMLRDLQGNLSHLLSLPEYTQVFNLIDQIYFKRKKYANKAARENYKKVMYTSGTYRNRINSGINYRNKLDGASLEMLPLPLESASPTPTSELPLSCHICKSQYVQLHHHYYALCPSCARFNYAQRLITADLASKTSLVTGGRVKIGFEIAKKLLRCGSKVIVTTRFPEDALRRYKIEEDYSAWAHNLILVYLDLINFQQILQFVQWVTERYGKLDILILNAAQTISREPIFYQSVQQDYSQSDTVITFEGRERLYNSNALSWSSLDCDIPVTRYLGAPTDISIEAGIGVPLELELDEDHQLKEYRKFNTWSERLDDFNMKDFLSILLINLFSPACLVRLLTPLLKKDKNGSEFSHVVLVSAVEGMFKINSKNSRHPHTNAAKAGLNMLTRTSASDYKERFNILINSVDTGFITVETVNETNFVPPLDNVDGMARVLHPIFKAVNEKEIIYGKMMKNFKPVDF